MNEICNVSKCFTIISHGHANKALLFLLYSCLFSGDVGLSFLVRFLLRNRTETLATQVT